MYHCWETSKQSRQLLIAYFKLFNKFLFKIEAIDRLELPFIDMEFMLELLFKQQTNFKFITNDIAFNLNKNQQALTSFLSVMGESLIKVESMTIKPDSNLYH